MAAPFDFTRPQIRRLVPFGRLPVAQRGTIPEGTFEVAIARQVPGWDEIGSPVPELPARKLRILYHRGMVRLSKSRNVGEVEVKEVKPQTDEASHVLRTADRLSTDDRSAIERARQNLSKHKNKQ